MCLIIAQPAGAKTVPLEHFKNAAEANPDGLGLMYVRGGRVVVKTRMKGVESFYEDYLVAARTGGPVVVHFRWATHGTKNLANVHPFFLRSDLAFCHNGVLPFEAEAGMSDTRVFARKVLKKLPRRFYKDEVLLHVIDRFIGSDKLVFLDGGGHLVIVGEKRGTWIDGCWYSNQYSIRPRIVVFAPVKAKASKGSKGKRGNGRRHKGRQIALWAEEEQEAMIATEGSLVRLDDPRVVGLHERAYIYEGEAYCLNCLPDDAMAAELAFLDLIAPEPIFCGCCGELLNIDPAAFWESDVLIPES